MQKWCSKNEFKTNWACSKSSSKNEFNTNWACSKSSSKPIEPVQNRVQKTSSKPIEPVQNRVQNQFFSNVADVGANFFLTWRTSGQFRFNVAGVGTKNVRKTSSSSSSSSLNLGVTLFRSLINACGECLGKFGCKSNPLCSSLHKERHTFNLYRRH